MRRVVHLLSNFTSFRPACSEIRFPPLPNMSVFSRCLLMDHPFEISNDWSGSEVYK